MGFWDIVNPILLTVGLTLWVWNGYILIFNKGIPNIKTAPAIRKKFIELIRADMAAKGKDDYTIIDMGCGNGTFSVQLARSIPEAQVIGLEISKLAFAHAELKRKKSGLPNLEFRNVDFYDADMTQADAVVMFLLGTLMKRIRAKLESDLKPGTLVLSNKFRVGGEWVPDAELDVKTLMPHQKTVFIYTKK